MFQPGEVQVQKFGGSSMATPERILKVAERVAEQVRAGRRIVLVVSAMGDTTDELLALMARISHDPPLREVDQLAATGEIVSVSVTAAALTRVGVKAKSFIAPTLGIRTDDRFGSAEITAFERLGELATFVREGGVPVVAGYQGVTPHGDFTTLGRGGSDITAVALARDLGQKLCEKFTDEDGVYSADPRLVPTARKVWHLDYREMDALARYGNGILHPRAIAYAREAGIRIHVRSSFTREEGSVVGPDGDSRHLVKSLAVDRKQAVVTVEGLRHRPDTSEAPTAWVVALPFSPTAWEWRTFDGITGSLRVGFRLGEAFQALPALWELAAEHQAEEVRFASTPAVISIVGCGLEANPELVPRLLRPLQAIGIHPWLVDHRGVRLTLAVSRDGANEAIELLHRTILSL
ncbi:MAG: Aspartokinase [Candidatus Ozemobacter sibiricus]|uniref:Aspartokinase n=1 Tax=Candidatus Ozemobacter sibiricus TaxID=2268124 RepID=A0A367ZKS4_9BACT|nr:MAG: Aspartokinase [Candidatus Ozemobacter sibiricus]